MPRDFRSRRAWLSGLAGLATAGLVAPRTRADPGAEPEGDEQTMPRVLIAGDSMIAGGLGLRAQLGSDLVADMF